MLTGGWFLVASRFDQVGEWVVMAIFLQIFCVNTICSCYDFYWEIKVGWKGLRITSA